MKKFAYSLLMIGIPIIVFAQRDYTAMVNPFIGTGGHGHTYPGASAPFGMMQLSPDTRMADWDGSSGYHYSDSMIYGFSHTHLSGTGIPDYCDLLFMPFTGKVEWNNQDYRSTFSHKNEKAAPGYYEVLLDKNKIRVQLTTTTRAGMHQYTFPSSAKEGAVLIDLKHRDEVLQSSFEMISPFEIKGLRRSRSWAPDQYLYFYIQFDEPITSFGYMDESGIEKKENKAEGKNLKLYVKFNLPVNKIIRARVGISGVNEEGAKKNLHSEIKDWNFERIRQQTRSSWNKELGKIDVQGGTKDQQVCFYTALYHTFLVPNTYQDVDRQFRGTDKKIHNSTNGINYSVFSLWDTYRAYHPLMTIINQARTRDWIQTFLNQYKYGGMLPVWELSGNETFCMIGYHSVPVIWDAYEKGIIYDKDNQLLKAMTDYANSDRFGLNYYRQYGYLGNDLEHESVSKTLEYAYDDWCISQFAGLKGYFENMVDSRLPDRSYDSIKNVFTERAQNWKNVFDPSTKNMRGKIQAMWYQPFDPKEINNFYTEGNSWQYTFAVPQDIYTLIRYHGGKDSFANKLNELFTTSSQTTGRDQADVTGLIGQYAQGNEPSHHMAYLFNYVGMPSRTQELTHKICTEFYKNDPDGLIGNEDCGQMSAWYILSSMGFYPVCPGNGEYVIGTPLFDLVTIHLENGKQFQIRSKKSSKDAFYVKGVRLNGTSYSKSYLLHTAIMKGGNIEFALSADKNSGWGTKPVDYPHSQIEGKEIVAAPFFDVEDNRFHDSLKVTVGNINPGVDLWISPVNEITEHEPSHFRRSMEYKGPFYISHSSTLQAEANSDTRSSKQVYQNFYKLPANRSITVLSKVHPMYTAGGPDALIDSIMGTANWKAGGWQSYFDQDFEAVVDLHTSRPVTYLALHVLQDVSPWILYPEEVIFFSSEDGKTFTEIGRVANKVDQKMETVQTQELGLPVSVTTRYIKVRAVNGGKLPAWHESAGNGSHLFLDEIIIK